MPKKVDFRKFLDPIRDLVLKIVSQFGIPEFRDYDLVPKITKYGDLLYYIFEKSSLKNQVEQTGSLVYFELDFCRPHKQKKSSSK